MEAAAARDAVYSLSALTAETSGYLARTVPEVTTRLRAVPKRATYAAQLRAFQQIHEITRPIVQHLLAFGEDIRSRVEIAFAVEPTFPLGEEIWAMALLTLDRARQNVEFCDVFRKQARQSRAAKVLWPPDWEERYDAILDAFADYSETIALGLDPEVCRELKARLADATATPTT